MVADEPELLPLSHPPQHDLHLPLARQTSQPNSLDVLPDVGDGERAVLPDDVEDGAGDGLRLLRRRRQLDRPHLGLPLLAHPPRRRREHLGSLEPPSRILISAAETRDHPPLSTPRRTRAALHQREKDEKNSPQEKEKEKDEKNRTERVWIANGPNGGAQVVIHGPPTTEATRRRPVLAGFLSQKKKKVLAGLATTKKQEQNGSLSATCCFHAERFPVAKRNSYLKNAVHLAPYLLELD